MAYLDKETFVCIDCEFTGLDPETDRILEVAIIRFTFSEVLESMESLIDPQCPISELSITIHHITPEMIVGKPLIQDVIPEICRIAGRHTIIGHGVGYDIEMLCKAAERANIPCSLKNNRILDTLRMARLYGECPINSLEQLRKHFNVPLEGAHRAMSDVIVNKEVFKHLCKKFKTTEQLFEALSKPILMPSMPLGKHKGRPLKEIPLQYLQWMVTKDFDQDLIYSLRTELKRRKKGNQFNQSANPFSNL